MNTAVEAKPAPPAPAPALMKIDKSSPALFVASPEVIGIKAGTEFNGRWFGEDTPVIHGVGLIPGSDYLVTAATDDAAAIVLTPGLVATDRIAHDNDAVLGGFHYAPGGNAGARGGGSDQPAINPYSLWDVAFRPACPDPRGMALIEGPGGRFWCDIYLLGVDHLAGGTSRFDATIADGADLPEGPAGDRYRRLDYETAKAIMAHHGKGLLSLDEFFVAAYGVTECSAVGREPRVTGLDAPRTSRFGIMQATGNMWVWGHDGDPDRPRASVFGGSWLLDGGAGSRYAGVGSWPEFSNDFLGARGRSDHLQPV